MRGDAGVPVSGVTHDSRQVRPGFLFAALSGAHTDGRRYVQAALEAGLGPVVDNPFHSILVRTIEVLYVFEEALRLADKIVIMREGKIVQYDSPFNILSHPADQFVRDLVGADDIVRQMQIYLLVNGEQVFMPVMTR